jgi:hypothetical protein
LVQTDDIIRTYNTTSATSTITGALQIAGGAGIGGNLYVGGTLLYVTNRGMAIGTSTITVAADPMGLTGSYSRGKVLDLYGALYIRQVSSSITPANYLGQGVYDGTTFIQASGAGNNFIWRTDSGQKMFLSNAGYFGLGTPPISDFHLQGAQFRHNDVNGWNTYTFTVSPGVVQLASTASFSIQTANVYVTSTSASTGTATGALIVYGGVGIGGNLNVKGIVYGGGVRTNTTTTTPVPADIGDIWYYQGTDVVYRYQFDGTTSTWVDISGPTAVGWYNK